jgi:hypothetical protein
MSLGRMPWASNSHTRAPLSKVAGLVDARGLCLSDALTLMPKVHLELGEHADHVKKSLAHRPAGVDRLLGRVRGRSASFDRPNDIFQIPHASGEPFDARYHGHMTDAFRNAYFDTLGLISLWISIAGYSMLHEPP